MTTKLVLPAAVAATLLAGAAFAQPGSEGDPIVVRMQRGADTVRLAGRLRQNKDCCAYRFKARAGQTLIWDVTGPAYRVTLTYPNGDTDGPGLPNRIPLPADGVYVFSVRANLMADGAFGPFVLTLTIPPSRESVPES